MTDNNNGNNDDNKPDDGKRWPRGWKLITSADDVFDVAQQIQEPNPQWHLSVHWIDTGGRPMEQALAYGPLHDTPFYCYDEIGFGAAINSQKACSAAVCRREKNRNLSWDPLQSVSALHIRPTKLNRSYAEEYPRDFSSSEQCMFTRSLQRNGFLLDEPTRRAAPDCLLLCEEESGLALPVPIGMVISWEADSVVLSINVYYPVTATVSDSADYANMDKEFDENLLREEARETEFYIARLIDLSRQENFQTEINFKRIYTNYCARITEIRAQYAQSRH